MEFFKIFLKIIPQNSPYGGVNVKEMVFFDFSINLFVAEIRKKWENVENLRSVLLSSEWRVYLLSFRYFLNSSYTFLRKIEKFCSRILDEMTYLVYDIENFVK